MDSFLVRVTTIWLDNLERVEDLVSLFSAGWVAALAITSPNFLFWDLALTGDLGMFVCLF